MRSVWKIYFSVLIISLWNPCQSRGQEHTYDVVVYGATAGGAVAAIAAAGEGAEVLLVEPGRNVGGMVTGGLSHNDYGDRTVIGGMALEFYQKVADYYDKPLYYWRGPEPHVGEDIFRNWLDQEGVKVLFEKRIVRVHKEEGWIDRIELSDGSRVSGNVFIDASYEGDLMARAGITYTIGREGISEYGESWAGRRAILPDGHQMLPGVSPFRNGSSGQLLPLIHPEPMVKEGDADKGVQGYGFRLIVTTDPALRISFPVPDTYSPDDFALIKRYYKLYPDAGNMVHLWPTLPHGKTDMNSSGPVSTNVIDGLNWEYPDAGYERRDEIWESMKDYTLGLLYFLSHDPSVPERIRNETAQMGLCRDEFTDNGYWPHQLYIREGRRMIGEYVMTQHDLQEDTMKYDAIGMGSYNIDVRHVQRTFIPVSRFPELHYEVYNEGYISIPVAPYEIPYRALLPKYNEAKNLLVPVCVSASHIAYASVRMEPQYMIMGQAAGTAAALASKEHKPVHQLDISRLRTLLAERNQILSLSQNPYGAFGYDSVIIIDNNMRRFVTKSGSWRGNETEQNGRFQMNFHENSQQEGMFGFRPWIPRPGTYRISIWYPSKDSYSEEVPVIVSHLQGSGQLMINQRENGGRWLELGMYELPGGSSQVVTICADSSEGTVVADAVKLEMINSK